MNYPSKTFFTADNHFGHENIIRHCDRPFKDVEEMDKEMTRIWNETVPHGSTVYIIGDFAWRTHDKYANRLNGSKILITGNHDKMSLDIQKCFAEVHQFGLNRKFFGKDYVLCHYALKVWLGSNYGATLLYGHSHQRIREDKYSKYCDVGVDGWNFRPVPFEIIESLMKTKIRSFNDNNDIGKQTALLNKAEHLNIWEQYENNAIV